MNEGKLRKLKELKGKNMKNNELKIIYKVEERLDRKLDDALEDCLKKLGWRRWASGYELETKERDLAFEKMPNDKKT